MTRTTLPPAPSRRRGFTPLTPMRGQAAKSMRRLAGHLQQAHPDMTTAQHVRDAARVLESGNEEAAQRHLRAAAFTLAPLSLMRHGLHTDDAHVAARRSMHGIHRHLLLVKDIADAAAKNQAARQSPENPGPDGMQLKMPKQFARTWDELGAVIDLASVSGRHVSGTPYEWKHGYIPLTPAAATSHFKGKTPKDWSPKPGKAGGPAVNAAHVAEANRIAENVRFERGLTRFQKEEAEQRLYRAAGFLKAGDKERAAAEVGETVHLTGTRGGEVIKGSTAAHARDLHDKIRAESAADGKADGDDQWWADDMPAEKPVPKPAPKEQWKQGGMFADPDRFGTTPMFGDAFGTSGVTDPAPGASTAPKPGSGNGILTGPHPADKMTVAADSRAAARSMSDGDLKAADAELARRAAVLGKPGQVSRSHRAVRAEIARRKNGGTQLARSWDEISAVIELVGPRGFVHSRSGPGTGQPGSGK